MDDFSSKEINIGFASLLSMIMGSTFVHEYSHMTALRSLFTNVDPYISCNLLSCSNNWNGSPVLRSELSITFETGVGIVAAAGPIADITNVALSSMIAWKMRHYNKKISQLFAAHAFVIATSTFLYCLSTLGSQNQSYDFVNIQSNLGLSHSVQTAITGSVVLGVHVLVKKILCEKSTELNSKKNI